MTNGNLKTLHGERLVGANQTFIEHAKNIQSGQEPKDHVSPIETQQHVSAEMTQMNSKVENVNDLETQELI